MIRSRVTLARLMALVLIAGLDCGLIRLFLSTEMESVGVLAFGLAISGGVVGWLLGRGRLSRFSAGFTLTGLGTAAAFVGWLLLVPRAGEWYMGTYLNAALRLVQDSGLWMIVEASSGRAATVGEFHPSVAALLVVEALISFPILIVALAGGLLALTFRRRDRSNPAPDTTPP